MSRLVSVSIIKPVITLKPVWVNFDMLVTSEDDVA